MGDGHRACNDRNMNALAGREADVVLGIIAGPAAGWLASGSISTIVFVKMTGQLIWLAHPPGRIVDLRHRGSMHRRLGPDVHRGMPGRLYLRRRARSLHPSRRVRGLRGV